MLTATVRWSVLSCRRAGNPIDSSARRVSSRRVALSRVGAHARAFRLSRAAKPLDLLPVYNRSLVLASIFLVRPPPRDRFPAFCRTKPDFFRSRRPPGWRCRISFEYASRPRFSLTRAWLAFARQRMRFPACAPGKSTSYRLSRSFGGTVLYYLHRPAVYR